MICYEVGVERKFENWYTVGILYLVSFGKHVLFDEVLLMIQL